MIKVRKKELFLSQQNKICDIALIDNLVLSGGGILGLAYVGVMRELEKRQASFKNYVGSSAGAISAMILAAGYTACEMEELMSTTQFKDLLDGGFDLPRALRDATYAFFCSPTIIYNLLSYKGLCAGESARKWLGYILEKKYGKGTKHYTFKDLYNKTNKGLYITNCNVSNERVEIMSHETTPSVRVVDAVLASMSIPFVFKPVEMGNDDNSCLDGGTTDNYEMDLLEGETIGLFLGSKESVLVPPHNKINDIFKVAAGVLGSLRNTAYNRVFSKQKNIDNTIFIDTGKFSSLDFDMRAEDMKKLIACGEKAVREYFEQK